MVIITKPFLAMGRHYYCLPVSSHPLGVSGSLPAWKGHVLHPPIKKPKDLIAERNELPVG